MDKIPPPLLAEYLFKVQPETIKKILIEDEAFTSKYGLKLVRIANIGNRISINLDELLKGLKSVLDTTNSGEIKDVDGNPVILIIGKDRNILISVKSDPDISIPIDDVFYVVSKNDDERVNAIKSFCNQVGPTFNKYSEFLKIAEERELTNHEINEIFDELSGGVASYQAKLNLALQSGTTNIDELVPPSIEYYHKFCGPNPNGTNPDNYFRENLSDYRAELIRKDLFSGMKIGLIGSLRDDLMPSIWLINSGDDEIWQALQICEPYADPFSLLGALDIALHRQNDHRFITFAEEAISKLLHEKYLLSNQVDAYELLPIFAKLAFDRLCLLEGGSSYPSYWRRMCAWMQACLILRFSSLYKVETKSLEKWVESQISVTSVLKKLLDLRDEPMYHAYQMDSFHLRNEILGRLFIIRDKFKKKDIEVPRSQDIDKVATELKDSHTYINVLLPGPLEGHDRPPNIDDRKVSEKEYRVGLDKLKKDPAGDTWSNFAFLSQFFKFDENLSEEVCELVTEIELDLTEEIRLQQIYKLSEACLFALAHNDNQLTECITEKVLSFANLTNSKDELVAILHLILIASANHKDENDWDTWSSEKLEYLAKKLPGGMICGELVDQLDILGSILPLRNQFQIKARAIADSGR